MHVFPYSLRSGTAASFMPQVDGKTKKERTHVLLALSDELEREYAQKFLHKTLDVITEEYEGEYTTGFTSNYLKVYLKGDYQLNQVYACQIEKIENHYVYARVVTCLNHELEV